MHATEKIMTVTSFNVFIKDPNVVALTSAPSIQRRMPGKAAKRKKKKESIDPLYDVIAIYRSPFACKSINQSLSHSLLTHLSLKLRLAHLLFIQTGVIDWIGGCRFVMIIFVLYP